MNDIFKDMQAKVDCEYISDLPSYKRKVWHEMKRRTLPIIRKSNWKIFLSMCLVCPTRYCRQL